MKRDLGEWCSAIVASGCLGIAMAVRGGATPFVLGTLFLTHGGVSQAASTLDLRAADFASKGFAETLHGCHLPQSCAGKRPISSRQEPIRETGNDSIVEEHNVRFDGLELSFLFVLGNSASPSPSDWKKGDPKPTPFITEVKITSTAWPVQRGLRIGATRGAVEKALGTLDIADDCARLVDERSMSEVTLCFANGRLRSLEWTPWWDG